MRFIHAAVSTDHFFFLNCLVAFHCTISLEIERLSGWGQGNHRGINVGEGGRKGNKDDVITLLIVGDFHDPRNVGGP